MEQSVEAILLLLEEVKLIDPSLGASREEWVGIYVWHSEATTPCEGRFRESDTDGWRAEVLVVIERIMLHNPDTEARFGNTEVGRGRQDAHEDVPLLVRGVSQVQGVWWGEQGVLLREEG